MTDGLDIVAVGIEHEGSVIIGVVVGTQAGRAVALAARSDRRAVEGTAARERAAKATCPRLKPSASPIQKRGLKFAPKPTAAP